MLPVFIGAFVLFGVTVVRFSSAAVTEPPMGLMVQLSSLSPTTTPVTLKSWFEQIRSDHRDRNRSGYINNLVLQDIADSSGNLNTAYLDAISPYLPGGATPAFDKVYVGTIDLPWTGSGSKYLEGFESATFRTENVNKSRTLAAAFKQRYPRVQINWYITYEANLAGFWDTKMASAYKTYLSQLMPALSGVSGGKAFLWSPAFWTNYSAEPDWALPGLKTNLADVFSSTPTKLILDMQDFVGQSKGGTTKDDAVTWANYLKTNFGDKLTSVQINAEQFRVQSDGSITAAESSEVVAREAYYRTKGLNVGPSWEIRYWHQRVYGN